MTITVVDINNHRPQFSPQGTVNATIRENMGQGTALTFINPLRITDLDEVTVLLLFLLLSWLLMPSDVIRHTGDMFRSSSLTCIRTAQFILNYGKCRVNIL